MKKNFKKVCGIVAAGFMTGGAALSGGCMTGKGRLEVKSTAVNTNGDCSVVVASGQLLNIPFLPDPAHSMIAFISAGEEKPIGKLEGVATSRKSGKMIAIGNPKDALFVENDVFVSCGDIIATEIFSGSFEEVMQKYFMALDAAHFMNEQNLSYDLVQIFGTAQNSNSVAASLVAAMELEFPQTNKKLMLPGNNRSLLPENWRSYYADWQPPSSDPDFLIWYAEKMMKEVKKVRDQNCPKQPRRDSIYFDPKNPCRPYHPLIIDDALRVYKKENSLFNIRELVPEILAEAPAASP